MNVIEDAYRRFCRRRFPPTSERDVASLEKRLQIRLPDGYRQYLLEFNGGYFDSPVITAVVEGCPEDALELLCGVGDVSNEADLGRELYLTLFDDNFPPKSMVIGCTPMGSLIMLDTAPGEGNGNIYFKQAYGEWYFLAEDIEEFFGLLREDTDVD